MIWYNTVQNSTNLYYDYQSKKCNYHYSPKYNLENISKTITTTQGVTTNIFSTHSVTIACIATWGSTGIIVSTKLWVLRQ